MAEHPEDRSARLSLGFSCIGHSYSHLFAPIFYVVALSLEKELTLSHGDVITLIVAGNVLYGLAAPLAGWLGDKWSSTGMMSLFFLGTGTGMILTGTVSTPLHIGLTLALTGLFASIYHPVGMAWLVRHAANRGMALGINGIFGSIGPAVAALSAGVLIEWFSWRAAFFVPGLLLVVTGVLFYWLVARGAINESRVDRKVDAPASRQDMVRAFVVLSVTMMCTGLIYQATQPALPKVFSERLTDLTSGGVFGISVLVAMVYFAAGAMQITAGKMADKYPLKYVYITAFMLQVPFLALAGSLGGTSLLVVAMIMVSVNSGALPAENSLVARYAPSKWRGLAFGLKFILTFGVSGLGVLLEGKLYDYTGGFYWLFVVLACVAVVAAMAALLLPNERSRAATAAAE
ncbi:MAG: MFS transporter [Rhodospirillaceae bacterium]|jgi:MFS transporter, FSR family, fosmidomycin resistance protein|nr:MFS transporter [Rhodospirillaceae bacterium]MBT5245651.1 MFS transporter [Rhodospirillaceae bacterium]MBT5561872.1 MFS transporter [Rhodospirillaceae bacterium]MBT6240478.1 MFS transporter [Rhodospirillaceae bacterium]MBT7136561.1 MFS transporter [Rhodospirillaceae bacterium]